jgi:hypothetical protein
MPPYCHNPPLGTRSNAKIRIRTTYAAAPYGFVAKIAYKNVQKCDPSDAGALRVGFSLILRLDVRSEKQNWQLLSDLERIEGKMQILSQVAEVVVEHPDGIVREVIFPRVKEEIFRNLVAEFHISGPRLRLLRQTIMERKFARHYRRMLPALLETLQFRSDNRFQPLIEGLAIIRSHSTVGISRRPFPSKMWSLPAFGRVVRRSVTILATEHLAVLSKGVCVFIACLL